MRATLALGLSLALLAQGIPLAAQQTAPPPPSQPVFHTGVNLVLVDVVVRDRTGAIVKGLTADDFDLREDGVKQQVVTFAYDEIATRAAAADSTTAPAGVAEPPVTASPARPLTSDETAGRRLITLLFDTSSMEPDDVQKAIDGASEWVDQRMTAADLVAVADVEPSLNVLSDFSNDKEQVRHALSLLSARSGTAYEAVDSSTAATDEASQTATDDTTAADASAQELDTLNNDVRLRALKTLAEALQPIQQKKAILYFSAGLQRSGTDNQVELRAAVNAAVRANAAIYPVDARGLQAVVPGGSARQASRGGLSAFTGGAVTAQFTQLADQQDTLTALASDTGGTAFTDTNDFGEAFTKIERDISAYYILGFASTNTAKDGRYRRLSVQVRNRSSVRVQAKEGYYADRDFAHTAKGDREMQLQEQLATPIPATDVPVYVVAGWFRMASDRYFVPISVAVPGSAMSSSQENPTLDIAGFIRDERGLPIGRIRDTLTVKPAGGLASRQILYQTSVTLPPGRFLARVVVRENSDGRMGTFETAINVPDLKQAAVKVSSILFSTQLTDAPSKTASPLVRDGVEIVPNLTHIVGRDQKAYLYYEVYDPAVESGAPKIRTSLAFYRGKTRVLETPVVERDRLDAADRHAALFQFELPGGSLPHGLYTCQVNIIDEAGGKFAFPRLQIFVR